MGACGNIYQFQVLNMVCLNRIREINIASIYASAYFSVDLV